jgi:hypothetical protein
MTSPPVAQVDQRMNLYETDPAVLREIDTQYSSQPLMQGAPLYQERLAAEVGATVAELGKPRGRALDGGCSVGRSTFELARHFDECFAGLVLSHYCSLAFVIPRLSPLNHRYSPGDYL